MRQLINNLDGIISKLNKRGPYGTMPARQYKPAGQQPVAMRCPGGEHAHGGFPYCHPEQRKHRVGSQQFHQEDARMKALESQMNDIGDSMYDMAKRGKVVPAGMKNNFRRIYAYLQRVQGTKRQRPINRMRKDGGGPGVGPLAPIDPWVGSDVHVDIPGGDRRNRKRQGIGVAPSIHKAADCPDGEHSHDRFDYCHPEKRKHRGGAKAKEPGRPFPPSRTIRQKSDAVFHEWHVARREEGSSSRLDDLYLRYRQLRELYGMARRWESSPEGVEWVNREKVKRAQGQGKRGQEHYAAKAKELEEKYKELEEEHEALWNRYNNIQSLGPEHHEAYTALAENVKQLKRVRAGITRAKSYAAVGFARDWTDIIKTIAGGTEPNISAVRTGSNAFAHYSMDSGIIGISDRALERLGKIRADPELLFSKGTDHERETYAFAVSALFHEFLHSVNPAVNAYIKGGITEMIEEGLTEAIANRMVARPDVLSSLLGRKVDEGIVAKPGTQYAIYVQTMEYMAERAAQKTKTDPEWFLGKWKFHTPPHTRGDVILDDASIPGDTYADKTWRGIITEAQDKLPAMQEARQASRMNKAFRWAVQSVLDNAWSVPVFKVAGGAGSYEPYPPSTPAPTGGGGSGPGSASSALVPSNMDVRHTGSPPKGVGWQKFPRQGGESIGGAGAGSVEAMRKHDTPRSPHRLHDPRSHAYTEQNEWEPLLDEFIDSETWIGPTCSSQAAARGQCADISLQFHDFLKQNGTESELIELEDFTGHGEAEYEAHTVVKVGDRYVDWTARQFDPDAPMPLVLDEEELAAYWGRQQRWTPEKYAWFADYLAPPKTRSPEEAESLLHAALDEPCETC